MKKYRVTYAVTHYEVYEIEVANVQDAEENFDNGRLVKCEDEGGNIQEVREIK